MCLGGAARGKWAAWDRSALTLGDAPHTLAPNSARVLQELPLKCILASTRHVGLGVLPGYNRNKEIAGFESAQASSSVLELTLGELELVWSQLKPDVDENEH